MREPTRPLEDPPEPDPLDALVREAFRAHEDWMLQGPSSVMFRLRGRAEGSHAGRAGGADRVDGEGASTERYQSLTRIAAGGMGVVLRGLDTDLGRNVAMKVLREEHALDPNLVERFLEEARVGGQLQHPGIVPVYELGLASDGRPYFTMKLVEGRTLSDLLATRSKPEQDRQRFLSIFEKVCQAMAYAHARGVVHRDLKPANVMVGEFGEIQVVDWGLAQVLDSGSISDPLGGAVVGTPGYMPPEQARGAVEQVDRRSDVYALGAVLFEILTGSLPSDAKDARPRLDAVDAHRDLSDLAQRCLAADPEERPADAGAIARAIEQHLGALAARAEEARLRAARAEVRADEEKRARKLILGLAASVLVTVVVAAFAWIRTESARSQRRSRVVAAASADLQEAQAFHAQAVAAEAGGPLWQEALAAAERARAHVSSEDTPEELRERALAFHASLHLENAAVESAAERQRAEQALLADLRDSLIGKWSPLYDLDLGQLDTNYQGIFGDRGFDVDGMGHEAAVAWLGSSEHGEKIAAHLLNWSIVRRFSRPPAVEDAERLVRIALDACPDPLLARVSETLAEKNAEALGALVGELAGSSLSAASFQVLAYGLVSLGQRDEARRVLRIGQSRHPGDFALNGSLGKLLYLADESEEALEFLRAAHALHPENQELAMLIADSLVRIGRSDAGKAVFQDILRREPEMVEALSGMSKALRKEGDLEGAMALGRRAIELDPEFAPAYHGLARALHLSGDLEAALPTMRDAARLAPENVENFLRLGQMARAAGLRSEALDAFRRAAELTPARAMSCMNLGVALLDTGNLDEAIENLHRAVDLDPDYVVAHRNLGVALQRKKDYVGAEEAFREAVRLEPDTAVHHELLASILFLREDHLGALDRLRESVRLDPARFKSSWNLGYWLHEGGDDGAALPYLRAAQSLAPDHFLPPAFLALILADSEDESLRDPDEAVRWGRRAVELAPDNGDWWEHLGLALYRADDHEASEAALARAMELKTEHPRSLLLLALIQEARGHHTEALELFGRAEQAGATTAEEDKTLERLHAETASLLRRR